MRSYHLGIPYEIVTGSKCFVYIDGVKQDKSFNLFSEALDWTWQMIEEMIESKIKAGK